MIRAILVDDEPLALHHLEKKLTELGTVTVVKAFSNIDAVLTEMKQLDFQVAFLDIEMPGLSGLDIAELIQAWNKEIHIVFVTAYRDYAIQAFELDSIDYLMKPVMTNRLEKTIKRIQEQLNLNANKPNIVENAATTLKIVCFGEFAVFNNETPVKWKTAKVKELFAIFISHLHTYINRDTLIHLLWPETDYSKAKIQLHTAISHLRKTLESIGSPGKLIFSNQSYTLELEHFHCDAIHFERTIAEHATINHTNIDLFEQLVQQYNGDYMEKNGYEWATVKSQSIRQKLLLLLQKMIDFYNDIGDSVKEQHYLQLLLHFNPYSEHVVQQLMHHHIWTGNRADAIKLYHHFKKQLIEELGILPDQTTNELYKSIITIHKS